MWFCGANTWHLIAFVTWWAGDAAIASEFPVFVLFVTSGVCDSAAVVRIDDIVGVVVGILVDNSFF